MDGTLLNENLEVSKRAIKAIIAAQNAGIEFAIATGRTLESGRSFIKDQGIVSPFIELNGARLFDETGEVKFTRAMNQFDLLEMLKIIDYYKINHEIITQKGSYSSNTEKEEYETHMETFKDINPAISEKELNEYVTGYMKQFKVNRVRDLNFFKKTSDLQVLKILFNSYKNPAIFAEIEKEISRKTDQLIVTSASNFNLEINHLKANKGKAVADFAKMRGYQSDEVITIGDNINDLTMLDWADHSYAVANAHQRAKEKATYLAPSHKEDAVAQIIEKVITGSNLEF